jgi:RNA polymerase sigma-70 factor (ECF subfamily)
MHPFRSLSQPDLEVYDRILRKTARRLSGCDHFADEITQEVWLEAYRHPPRHLDSLGGWLRVAATRAASRLRKRDANRRYRERATAQAERTPSFEEEVQLRALRARIRRATDHLGEPYREVVRLHFEENLSSLEIAAQLQRSENTVRSQLRRGMQKLRHELREEGERLGAFALLLFLFRKHRWGLSGSVAAVGATLLLVSATPTLFGWAEPHPSGTRRPADATRAVSVASLDRRPPPVVSADSNPDRTHVPPAGHDRARLELNATGLAATTAAPSVAVRGQVERKNKPYAGAEIWVAESDRPDVGRVVALADEDGRFEVSGLEPRQWIWADGAGLAPSFRHRVDTVNAAARDSLHLRVGRPLGRLGVRVVDHLGRPVAGARVVFERLENRRPGWGGSGTLRLDPPAPEVTTDWEGRGSLDQPNTPKGHVLVLADGLVNYMEAFEFRTGFLEGEMALTLPEPARLTGRLFGPEGLPVSRATVRAESRAFLPDVETTTDANGDYELQHLAPGPITVIAFAPGGAAPGTERMTLDLVSGQNLRDLRLSETAAVVGQLLCANEPVPGARIEAWAPASSEPALVSHADSQGRFRFDGLAQEGHALFVYADGNRRFPSARVSAVEPGWTDVVELPAHEPLRRLVGRVDLGERDGAIVYELVGPSLPQPLAFTLDEVGGFDIDGVPNGSYELLALVPSCGPHVLADLRLEGQGVHDLQNLTLPRPASLRVLVHSPDGSPLSFLTAGLYDGDLRLTGYNEPGGNLVSVSAAPPGDYLLKLRMRKMASILVPVRLRDGEAYELAVEAVPGATVSLSFHLPGPLAIGERLFCEDTLDGVTRDVSGLFFEPNGRRKDWGMPLEWPPGTHSIRTWTTTGLRGEAAFEVRLGDEQRTVAIELW